MSSLNKFELNKLIVSMRHNVKRAKVQTVNKLIRQGKQLKNKKALDELKKKNETKAERLVNEVLIMKKIPPDEVSAFTLSNTKKVNEILSDPNSSLRLKALARLSNHKSLTPIVTQFRTRYPLWEMEFPKVLIALKKREKIKAANKDTKNEISENEEESSEDEIPELGSEDEAISDQEIVLHSTERRMSNTNSNSSNTLAVECEIVSTRGNRFSVSSDDFEPKTSVRSQENLIECEKPSSVSTPNGESGKVTKINKSDLEITRKENIGGKRQLDNNSHSNQIIKKTTDSFFLSTDNKPHKTIDHSANKKNKIYNDDTDENDSYDSDSERSRPKEFSLKKNNRFNKNPKESKNFNLKNTSNIFNKSKKNGFENKKNVNRSKGQLIKSTNESGEKLHPSWAAKKKMVSIANFEGKKVTFD